MAIVRIERDGKVWARRLLRRIQPFEKWKQATKAGPIAQAMYILIVANLEQIAEYGAIREIVSVESRASTKKKRRRSCKVEGHDGQ